MENNSFLNAAAPQGKMGHVCGLWNCQPSCDTCMHKRGVDLDLTQRYLNVAGLFLWKSDFLLPSLWWKNISFWSIIFSSVELFYLFNSFYFILFIYFLIPSEKWEKSVEYLEKRKEKKQKLKYCLAVMPSPWCYRVFLRVKTEQEVVDEEAHRKLTLSETFQTENHKKQRNKIYLGYALNLYKILWDFWVKFLVEQTQGRKKVSYLLWANSIDLSGLIIFCWPCQSQVKLVFSTNWG